MIRIGNEHQNKKHSNIFRVVVILVFAFSLFVGQRVKAQTIAADGPFQTQVTIQTVDPSPSFIEQPFIVSVLVEPLDLLGGTPNGVVELKTGGEKICDITLDSSGAGSCELTFNTPATVPLQAFYIGNDTFLPAASASYNHIVRNKFVPVVSITNDTPDPSIINRLVRVSVSVTSGYDSAAVGGVTIYRNASGVCLAEEAVSAADRCELTLDSFGEGDCDLPLTREGLVDLCAVYPGDIAHFPAVSTPEPHRVSTSNTFVSISSITPSPSVLGDEVTVNFQVTSPDGTPQNGIVTVFVENSAFCNAPVSAGSCAAPLDLPDELVFFASYGGETDGQILLQPSVSDPYSHYVQAAPTQILSSKSKINTYRDREEVVATLSALDPNPQDEFTFMLVSGEGDRSNRSFRIVEDQLIALGNIAYGDGRVSIRLRATDPAGLFFEQSLVFSLINNVPELPDTGFAPSKVTQLPSEKVYQKPYDGVYIEIPVLDLSTTITGVALQEPTWNTDWLGAQVGWLHGSAFPGWQGNSYLAGHNYLPSGLPGPFHQVENLQWGDRIYVTTFGTTSIYEVRSVDWVSPKNRQVLTHEEEAWLTLITCDQYDEKSESYRWRVVVRAVLVDVK